MENTKKRLVDFKTLREYLPYIGRDNSRNLARHAGAIVYVGKTKYLYDLDKIDAALEEMTASRNA